MRSALAGLPGTEAGRAEHAMGAGGDRTLEVDRIAESAAMQVLEAEAAAGARFSLLSEEAGLLDFGAPYPLVIMDPVDGSLNAKQGVPVFAVMLSLLDGPDVGDTAAGYVQNLATGEEWTAIRGRGATRGGRALVPLPPQEASRVELLGVESSPRSVARAEALLRRSHRVRILGSVCISLALTASGGLDVFVAPFPARVFDMTAGLLMLRETGGVATDLEGRPLDRLEARLDTRTPLVAASSERLHALALDALRAG